ncbi:prepilin peptidase [Fusobacterium russii]|uniref:prepilin peptidase n=1 Tax=Fusobacterium russii TaxID=854 RepID=UPI00039B4F96|nr:A24 family peptidase [Fusobacterium russii]
MDRLLTYTLYLMLLLIIYIDINKKYIPNFLNFSLLILCFFVRGADKILLFFIGASVYTLPVLLLYAYVSDLLKKDVIGFGDIKLIMALGGLLYVENINLFLQIYIFYLITFVSASSFILFLCIHKYLFKKNYSLKNKEIAFAPFICLSFIFLYNFNFILEHIL